MNSAELQAVKAGEVVQMILSRIQAGESPAWGWQPTVGARCGNCGMSFGEKLERVYRLEKSSQ